ncbi:hypothetical protein P3L10_030531 [Capsicum annuum]
MDEIWINYCGMPIYFGLKEFAIVTGLICDHPEEPLIKETPQKGSSKLKGKKDGLLGIVECSIYKAADLMADLEDKDIPKHCREKLCLVWFVYSVLLARDVRKVILSTRTITLYGFPWAFMAWACEAIPPLKKQFKDYPDEVFHPWILRWLATTKGGKKI